MVHYKTVQYSTVQYSIVQYSRRSRLNARQQYSTVQYSIVTVQHAEPSQRPPTAQCSTAQRQFLYCWGRPRKPVALGMTPDLCLPKRNEHLCAAGADPGSLWPWEWNQTCTTKAAEWCQRSRTSVDGPVHTNVEIGRPPLPGHRP